MPKKVKQSGLRGPLLRNLLILAMSISVVVATQAIRTYVSAGETGTSKDEQKYVDLLNSEKDFEIDCLEFPSVAMDDIDRVIKKYHKVINCKFNTKIKRMVELGKTGDKKDLDKLAGLLRPPPQIFDPDTKLPTGRKACDGENLSTYCLAVDSTKEFFAFRKAMIAARSKSKREMGGRYETVTGKNPNEIQPGESAAESRTMFGALGDRLQGDKSIQSYGEDVARIDDAIIVGQQSLDQALSAYNELQMALPLHKKYQALIKSLEKYRNKISAIRREVELYPSTFLDVTTTQCN